MLRILNTPETLRVLLAALALALAGAGCTGGEEEPAAAATLEEPADETSSESAEPSPPPSPSPSEAVLPEEFEQDSDGNAIPDFLEESTGYDPLNDDCARQTCPGAEGLDPTVTGSVDQNVMLLLDASGSMAGPDGSGQVKIDAARATLERYAYGVPPNFRLGLEVFGHRGSNTESGKAESCAGIDIVSPLGSLTADSAAGALNQFQPTGYTPIAAALQRAAEAFAGTEGAGNRVTLVTDGIETCDGDPIAAAAALKQAGIAVTVDVVGFDIDIEGDADRRPPGHRRRHRRHLQQRPGRRRPRRLLRRPARPSLRHPRHPRVRGERVQRGLRLRERHPGRGTAGGVRPVQGGGRPRRLHAHARLRRRRAAALLQGHPRGGRGAARHRGA